jgi:uncharacterized protein
MKTRGYSLLLVALFLALQTAGANTANELRKLAESGEATAQNNLGFMYANGVGVPKDEAEAVKWFRKAAIQGNAQAQSNLGIAYGNGEVVPQDDVEAVKWYRKAADQGDAQAQFVLGLTFYNGTDGLTKDKAEALKLFRQAAHQGNLSAQLMLSLMFDPISLWDHPKDQREARFWSRKAADQKNAFATNTDSDFQLSRTVPQFGVAVVEWFRKAADRGNAFAQNNLGFIYANGEGLPKDDIEAYKWWLLAGAQGNELAKKNMSLLEARLTPDQRAEGQRLAREWKPKK